MLTKWSTERRSPRGPRGQAKVASLLAAVMVLAACGGSNETSAPATPAPQAPQPQAPEAPAPDFSGEKLIMIPQFGLAYLPHHAMIQEGFLEARLPGIQVEETQLSGGGAVVEQLITGNIDVGYMGIPPYLTAWSRGVDVRVAAGLGSMPMELMTWKDGYSSLSDIQPNDIIAVPGPSSFQAATLRAAAKELFGDEKYFDARLVGLAHPDAEAALVGKAEVTAHFGQLPFTRRHKDRGFSTLLSSYEVFGRHTLIVAVVASDFETRRPEVFAGFVAALEDATRWIAENPEKAAQLMIDLGDASELADLVADVKNADLDWDNIPRNIVKIGAKLLEVGALDSAPATFEEVTTSNLHGGQGS